MAAAGQEGGAITGDGETQDLLLTVDWSATSLGPMTSWPPVLRMMVRGCLASSFPIVIHWGPERVALYNDAYARLIGGKHPAAFGRPAKEIWPEAWDLVGGRLDEVIRFDRTLHAEDEQRIMNRHGYPEECYFSYSHSPIGDIHGDAAGVFTVSTETTTKVLYERRMRVVRDLGSLSISDAGSAEETCRAVLGVLATARETMPFAVAFLREEGGHLRRVADYGVAAEPAGREWRDVIDRVLASGRTEEVTGLRTRFPGALQPGPLGPLTPDTAVALPLTVSGRIDPIGVLALGVNPYRPLNPEYRSYIALVARQVGVALTDSVAYEGQRLRSQLLGDLDRAKMEFFQNVSHELRTPLTLLLAPLQNLLTSSADRPESELQDLQAAVRAAERLRTMVDALLGFSGAEAGTLQPNRLDTDLAELTAQTCSMFRATAEHAGLDFIVEVPDNPMTVAVDRAMWSSIVTNLLSNAVKYTRRGGIKVRLTAADYDAVLTVTDTGQGIDAEQQPLVFERFHRAPGDVDEEGAGIGLAVVADLVDAHDGHLDLTSSPGEGSTFRVAIPLSPFAAPDLGNADPVSSQTLAGDSVPPAPVLAIGPESSPSDSEANADAPVILVVEDDTDLREFLARLLAKDGWIVRATADAEAALLAVSGANQSVPHVILTDVMLPGIDGLALIQQLRQRSASARIPMIVLTARHGTDATAEGLAAGADDYITKPFSTDELLARVHANHALAQVREAAVADATSRGEQLRAGLQSNRVIGTAIGILMTSHRLTAAQAFQLLTHASQHSNRKLRDIAADVAGSGQLPLRPTLVDELLVRVSDTPPG